MTISAQQALARLEEGNRRFVGGVRTVRTELSQTRRPTAADQRPFAIILGCSDSRVPAEIIFDQGLGDLFVIRVAGNIVAPSQVGSVEFAASRFGTPLVVVLGHTQCGAILATIEEVRRPAGISPGIRSIVDRIRPVAETLLETELQHNDDRLVREVERANVRASVDHLRHGSALLEELIEDGLLAVVGAEYSLETGKVDFFEGATHVGMLEVSR